MGVAADNTQAAVRKQVARNRKAADDRASSCDPLLDHVPGADRDLRASLARLRYRSGPQTPGSPTGRRAERPE